MREKKAEGLWAGGDVPTHMTKEIQIGQGDTQTQKIEFHGIMPSEKLFCNVGVSPKTMPRRMKNSKGSKECHKIHSKMLSLSGVAQPVGVPQHMPPEHS